MNKDTLFLLPPGFEDQGQREYCPECAELWGLLSYFPAIKESLNITYQDIDKPRKEMLSLLGADNQNCPTLVLHPESPEYQNCIYKTFDDKRFIDNARNIGKYYSARFGTPMPR